MKEVFEYPPNIESIRKVFTFTRKVIFAYGDILYNPDHVRLDPYIIAHEEVHQMQQAAMTGGVEEWWKQYLLSPNFRLMQEIPAYREQYRRAAHYIKDSNKIYGYGRALATALSGDTYGNCISFDEALNEITA